MDTYKNKINGLIVQPISMDACGMCGKTIGMTMVIYRYSDDTTSPLFAMELKEFFKNHDKLKK